MSHELKTLSKADLHHLQEFYMTRIEKFSKTVEQYEEALENIEKQLDYLEANPAEDLPQ